MANSKISALTSATTPLAGTETLPVVQSGATKQVSVANLTAGRQVDMSYLNISSTAGLIGNVNTTTANGAYLRWQTNGTSIWDLGTAKQVFNTGTGNDGGFATRAGYYLGLGANGAESLRLTTDGNATIVQAAKGINFTANTPAAGMTSRLLNWYEEGTWTPVPTPVSGTITSYTSTGRYTRIGNQVTVALRLDITNVGTAGALANISGLPFTSSSAASVSAGAFREVGATGDSWTFYVTPSTTVLVGRTYNNSSAIATGYIFYGSCTYFTA